VRRTLSRSPITAIAIAISIAASLLLSACGADEISEDLPTRTTRDATSDLGDLVSSSDTSGALDASSSGLDAGTSGTSGDTSGTSGTSGDTSGTSGTSGDTSGTSGTSGDTSGTSGTSGDTSGTADDTSGASDTLDTSGASDTSGAPDTSGASDTSGGMDTSGGDRDGDNIPDSADNCPDNPNNSQLDTDVDGVGDACDPDIDGDNIPNAADNCPHDPSTNLTDTDGDGQGDVCDPDIDNDGVPNDVDRWPTESGWPTIALPNTVYAHTSSALYAMDVYPPYQITSRGNFTWPSGTVSSQMTDLAIDRYGVIYGVSFSDLFICRADNGQCRRLGALPSNRSFNGLTWTPAGTVLPDREALVGIAQDGAWYRLDIPAGGGNITATQIGAYPTGYTSSGDAFAIEGVGLFAAVNKDTSPYDFLVEVNSAGGVIRELGPISTYSSIWGVAGWSGKFFGFDESGAVLQIAISGGAAPTVTTIHSTSIPWWGAGVRTVIIN
jgi:hypothetical protein